MLQLLFLIFVLPLQADWNHDFDKQSQLLVESLPCFQNPHYCDEYNTFVEIRKILLEDKSLQNKIKNEDPQNKLVLFQKTNDLFIKKRRNDCINELFIWELSYLLNSPEFIVPSFPVHIGGKAVIVQKKEMIEIGKGEFDCPSEDLLKKVSLKNYWKAHILAYLLGFRDLAGRNIGVNTGGMIRFFDNESSFKYVSIKNGGGFTIPFVSQSFDWPQYRIPLDQKTAESLKHFVNSLSDFENELKQYISLRKLTISEQDLNLRLHMLRNFPLKKGATFRDLYGSLFPQLSPGLDQLNHIVGKIVNHKVDHGTALYFVWRKKKKYNLSDKDNLALDRWIETYTQST